jgi:hypothetical protein
MTKTIRECMEEFELLMDYIRGLEEAKKWGDIKEFRINWNTTDDELIADIFIIPAKTVPYINLNFVAVKTGITFDEVIKKDVV